MADGDAPKSPPLPKRGTYNIDFDSLDDNPFESKVKLGSSPPIQSSSSYNFDADAFDDIDPFKPRKAVANSPVGSPKSKSPLQNFSNNNNNNNNNGPVALDASQPEDNVDSPRQEEAAREAASKPSPKKKRVLKKPKGQSKIKPPRNVKPPDSASDEIQIFAPGEKSNAAAADGGDISLPQHQGDNAIIEPQHEHENPLLRDEDLPPPPPELLAVDDSVVDKKERPSSLEEEVPYDPAPEAMVSSSEMDTQFVNADDVDDLPQDLSQSKKKANSKNTQGNTKEKTSEPQTVIENEEDDIYNKEKVTKISGSQQQQQLSPEQHSSDDGSPAVKKSPRGQQHQQQAGGESGGPDKHPAARVLEANVADDGKKAADPKNDTSSELEENTFYDAVEFPSSTSAASTFGQRSNSGGGAMQQRTPSPSTDGSTGKQQGTMVQLVQVLRYSQSDWNKLRQELELGFQAQLLTKEREWSALLGERDKRLEQADETNKRLRQTCEDMRSVVAEFEKTISQLQADKERHKKDLNKTTSELENERDQAIEDLQSVESAFSDLHRRYEKSKGIIEGFKKNEEQLKQHVEELQAKLVKSEAKLQSLRSQAEEKLDRANEDIEQIKKSTKSEVARLEAALKKSEIRICTLDESLQRKEKENEELTAICDELIAKVGS